MQGPAGTPITVTDIVAACNGANGSVVLDNNFDWPAHIVITNSLGQQVYNYDQVTSELVPDLLPDDYTIMQFWTWSMLNSCTPIYSSFTVPDLSPNCGNVHGTSWYDLDADCVRDQGEVGIPYSVLLIEPGELYVLTNSDGTYDFNIGNGSYTMAQLDPTLIHYCPGTQPVPFVVNSSDPAVDLANGSTVPLDLSLHTVQGVARPGFAYSFSGSVRNHTPQVSGPVTVTASFDPALIYLNGTPMPTSVSGNTITWNFGPLTSFDQTEFNATFTVPAATPLGTMLTSTVSASNTLTESTLANNTTIVQATVIGSYDPNDKTAATSSGFSNSFYYIDADEWIDYTIRFQNTGTASAIDVVITDTLPAELDMASFEQGAASHSFEVSFKTDRVVEWRFANIQLPDSGTNEAASHGAVGFRIRPQLPLLAGTVIENIANIYFDFNPPVITEPSVLVAEFSTGQAEGPGEDGKQQHLTLFPNPAHDRVRLVLPQGTSSPVWVEVLTVDGRTAMTVRVAQGEEFSVLGLAPGSYLMRVRNADGSAVARLVTY